MEKTRGRNSETSQKPCLMKTCEICESPLKSVQSRERDWELFVCTKCNRKIWIIDKPLKEIRKG